LFFAARDAKAEVPPVIGRLTVFTRKTVTVSNVGENPPCVVA
jgi:hypothetical protein